MLSSGVRGRGELQVACMQVVGARERVGATPLSLAGARTGSFSSFEPCSFSTAGCPVTEGFSFALKAGRRNSASSRCDS